MVLTQDLGIASYVDREFDDASVVMLGGALRPKHGYCWGPLTVSVVSQLFADKAFLGANGFVPEQGFMTEDPYASETKHSFVEHAQQTVVLLDSSKVSQHSFVKFADLSEVDLIVMDEDPGGVVGRASAAADPSPRLLLAGERKGS